MDNCNYQGAGVYKISIGTHIYVGSSRNVTRRIRDHILAAKGGREKRKIQLAYNEVGYMHVDIIEKIGDNNTYLYLLQREKYWIEALHADLNSAPVLAYDPVQYVAECRDRILQLKGEIRKIEGYIKSTEDKYFCPIGGEANAKKDKNATKQAANKRKIS